MRRGETGRYLTISTAGGERVRAFLPAPLPPAPPLSIDSSVRERLDRALVALGPLDSVTSLLPHTSLLLHTSIRKEAGTSPPAGRCSPRLWSSSPYPPRRLCWHAT